MEIFDPQHRYHRNVPWPNNLQILTIWLPHSIVQLLAHNDPPSPEETGHITDFHRTVQRESAENGERIRGLRQQIKQLKKEQRLLEKRFFACEVVLSPFRRLPLDILQQIASHHAAPSNFRAGSLLSPRSHFPLLLAQVSRTWRHITYGTSYFWQKLRLPLRTGWDGTNEPVIDEMEHFGRLSGRLPLSVQLQDIFMTDSLDGPFSHIAVLPWIFSSWPERHRLTKLSIHSSQISALVQYLRDLLCGHAAPFSNLRSLLLFNTNREAFPIENTCDGQLITQIWQNMPDLRHVWVDLREVVLDVDELHKVSILSDTPWSKLSTLYIRMPFQPREWTTFVKACPNLESAWLFISGPNQPLSNPFLQLPPTPHPHRRLRELIIHFCGYSTHILTPFAGIQFPNLETLQVKFSNCKLKTSRVTGDINLILPFPSLRSLIVLQASSISKNIRGLFPLFLATPSVVSLSLSFFHQYVVDFVDFLRGMSAGVLPLPKMETLTLWLSAEAANPGSKHESWPKEIDRILTLSLLETWEARRSNFDELVPIHHAGLISMLVEFHTWPRSSDEILQYEGEAGTDVEWTGSQLAMISAFNYVRRKVARRGRGIEIAMRQGESARSFGAPMEERLKNRY